MVGAPTGAGAPLLTAGIALAGLAGTGTAGYMAIAGLGFTDVCAAVLPTVAFAPVVHLNYAETVLPMKDGLPKLRDFPAEAGGSGELVPE